MIRQKRIGAAIQVGIKRVKRRLPLVNVGGLTIRIPRFIGEIMKPLIREDVHNVKFVFLTAIGLRRLRHEPGRRQEGQDQKERSNPIHAG